MKQLSESELQELAAQLKKPTGANGTQVAQRMEVNNANLINTTFSALNLTPADNLLEIGFGNGSHVATLPQDIAYTGIDVSEDMVKEAQLANANRPNTLFITGNGTSLPFPDNTFTAIATVNTIYFWENPAGYTAEITRVLTPGGRVAIGFVPQSTMQLLPFTRYGFTHYTTPQVTKLLEGAGLTVENILETTEPITISISEASEREITVITAVKR